MPRHTEKTFFGGNITLPPLTAALNHICKTVESEGLGEETSLALEEPLSVVSSHFGISPLGAVLLGHITEHSAMNGSDEDDLSHYVGCSNIEFIGFHKDLDELEKKGIVFRGSNRGGRRTFYVISKEAAKSIETGCPYVPFSWEGLTSDEFFTRVRLFFSDYRQDVIDSDRLLENIISLMDCNPDLPFCRSVKGSTLPGTCTETEQRFFFYLCHRFVTFGDPSVPVERLLNLTGFMEDEQRLRRALANEATSLQATGLVCFAGEDAFRDMDSLSLSDEVKSTFFEGIQLAPKSEGSVKGLVRSNSITPRDLFYNADVQGQMDRLASLLEPSNFRDVQKRLGEMGMRKGFAVLFSGGAGCGKTAGAYELARRTGRDIFAVDMSELKSKWVGDSEKIVKGVFNNYAQMCRTRDNAPILLFNEADAIFSKRMENPQDSVDQMMNAIQNICLDAIENLDGILIATTNLADNFCDEAFARRFIFKVNFTTPQPETRAKIWQSMLSGLSDEDALILGRKYALSGGNIENIARKAAVGYVLSGKKADMDELLHYCEEETLAGPKAARRIGF